MNPIDGASFVRPTAVSAQVLRRGYCGVGLPPEGVLKAQDIACDVVTTMDRFPAFPTRG